MKKTRLVKTSFKIDFCKLRRLNGKLAINKKYLVIRLILVGILEFKFWNSIGLVVTILIACKSESAKNCQNLEKWL